MDCISVIKFDLEMWFLFKAVYDKIKTGVEEFAY